MDYLKGLPNVWARKTHGGMYQAGLPDVIASKNGRLHGFEVKRPPTKPYDMPNWDALTPEEVRKVARAMGATALQAADLYEIRESGGLAAVVTSVEEVKALMGEE